MLLVIGKVTFELLFKSKCIFGYYLIIWLYQSRRIGGKSYFFICIVEGP